MKDGETFMGALVLLTLVLIAVLCVFAVLLFKAGAL